MSILGNSLLLGADAAPAATGISRSLRFNSADSAYLSRTPTSTGNRTTWSLAMWVKRSAITTGGAAALMSLFGWQSGGTGQSGIIGYDASTDKLFFGQVASTYRITNAVFRDVGAWAHLLFVWDSNNSTDSQRCRIYVNGSEASYSSAPSISSGTQLDVNTTVAHSVGADIEKGTNNARDFFSGYLADIYFIDGQALDPTSFGETDATTGVWNPKAYTGSYGTNGWHLELADNSAATATTLGKDTSGNGNNWTPNNFSVSGDTYFVDSRGSSLDGYIPGGWTRTSDPFTTLVNNQTGVIVDYDGAGYFAITPTSTTVTIKWIVYDGSGNANPTVTLSTSRWSGTVSPSSTTGSGSTGSPSVGTYTVTVGTTYYVRTGLVGNGNPALVVYVTGATIASLGTSVTASAGIDSLVDVPTNGAQTDTGAGGEVRGNYCTWNPLATGNLTAVDGNLGVKPASNNWQQIKGTISVSSGKWYWENTVNPSSTYINQYHGISNYTEKPTDNLGTVTGYCYGHNGDKYYAGSYATGAGASYTFGDVIGIALDLDSGTQTVKFYKNGVLQFTQTISGQAPWHPASNCYYAQTPTVFDTNFGQRPFAYTAPSGFKALCTTNLPAPLVTKPSTVMDVKLYTGTGSTQSITGLGFSPDLVWLKARSISYSHQLYDVIRGTTNALVSNTTAAEAVYSGGLTAFNSDGFTIGNDGGINQSSNTFVAWAWDAGSSTVTNTAGSITSSVRANATAGFSICSWTAPSSGDFTWGHGLGVEPYMVIIKTRDSSGYNWRVYHKSIITGVRENIDLNSTGAKFTSGANMWGSALPTSTVVGSTAGNTVGGNDKSIAYCFAPVVGYSSFGSYTGNGSTDGPFVFCNFRPRWIMIKCSSSAAEWRIYDAARLGYNAVATILVPNSSQAEGTTGYPLDIVSNGFKIRAPGDDTVLNSNGATYVYIAFAESPFNYSRAR